MSLVALVLTGMVPYTELSVPDPVAVAIDVIGIALALASWSSSARSPG